MTDCRILTSELIGDRDAIRAVRDVARRAAQGAATVLIAGASRVGTDVVAQFIHRHSARVSRNFVPVNCARRSDTRRESERFSWLGEREDAGPEHLPATVTEASRSIAPRDTHRARPIDDRYRAPATGREGVWDRVYTPFPSRDPTRADRRGLVRRGLARASGRHREPLALFGMPQSDRRRFRHSVAAPGCWVDARTVWPVREVAADRG